MTIRSVPAVGQRPSAPIVAGEHRFAAMGSEAHVVVTATTADAVERALQLAERRVEALEACWSRFRPTSELSMVNRRSADSPGRAIGLSADLFVLIARMVEGMEVTGGDFDPTMLASLRSLGYDCSFELIDRRGAGADALSASAPRRAAPVPIELDRHLRTVRLAPGVQLDPGGIGKGLAADLTVDTLRATGVTGCSVNLGGDVRVWGEAPDGGEWVIGIAHPIDDTLVAHLSLSDGAVATSTPLLRRWLGDDGQERHHLLDPSSGSPTTGSLASVSVAAGQAWLAEVATKAVAVAVGRPEHGISAALALVERLGLAALVVDDDGVVHQRGTVGSSPSAASARSASSRIEANTAA